MTAADSGTGCLSAQRYEPEIHCGTSSFINRQAGNDNVVLIAYYLHIIDEYQCSDDDLVQHFTH